MARAKLSPEAKQLADAAALQPRAPTEGRRETDVLVRTARELSRADLASLEALGVGVRTVAGDVLTARVPVDRLAELAELEIVRYIEVSRPLTAE